MAERLSQRIEEGALPILEGLGYDLADLELVKEGANWYLRFFIDNPDQEGSINTDDCQKASEALSAWLDEVDPIPQAYFLEVSSPGIERVLKKERDFLRFAGRLVKVAFYSPWQGEKSLVGTLRQVDKEYLYLVGEGDLPIDVPREKIARVHLYWDGAEEKEE